MYWLEWRCHSITVAGALNNEDKMSQQLVLNVKWQWKQHCLQFRQNSCNDDSARIEDGKPFQACAAATGKARSPSVTRLVDGTIMSTKG